MLRLVFGLGLRRFVLFGVLYGGWFWSFCVVRCFVVERGVLFAANFIVRNGPVPQHMFWLHAAQYVSLSESISNPDLRLMSLVISGEWES